MSLASRFKTDVKSATEGVWFEYEPNTDGSKPRFKLKRAGQQNKKYQEAIRKLSKDFAGANGKVDLDRLTGDEGEEKTRHAFVAHVIADWENFQPEDDGNSVPYTQEAAMDILTKPEWADLFDDLALKATDTAHYAYKEREESAKN